MRTNDDRDVSHRTVFVSDTHLGSRGVQADRFLDFLRRLSCERLYLIGDIVDFWELRRRWHWAPSHGLVLAELLGLARRGVRVTYVPGNHDWFIRAVPDLDISGVEIVREAVHETATGRKLLVVHGDQFDRSGRLANFAGDVAASLIHAAGAVTNRARSAVGLPYYPLGAVIRQRIQHLVPYVAGFEASATAFARQSGLDGVICGHVHIAALKHIDGTLYGNTGDWVDSCTAISEDRTGRLDLIDWAAHRARRASRAHSIRRIRRMAPELAGWPLDLDPA